MKYPLIILTIFIYIVLFAMSVRVWTLYETDGKCEAISVCPCAEINSVACNGEDMYPHRKLVK